MEMSSGQTRRCKGLILQAGIVGAVLRDGWNSAARHKFITRLSSTCRRVCQAADQPKRRGHLHLFITFERPVIGNREGRADKTNQPAGGGRLAATVGQKGGLTWLSCTFAERPSHLLHCPGRPRSGRKLSRTRLTELSSHQETPRCSCRSGLAISPLGVRLSA